MRGSVKFMKRDVLNILAEAVQEALPIEFAGGMSGLAGEPA